MEVTSSADCTVFATLLNSVTSNEFHHRSEVAGSRFPLTQSRIVKAISHAALIVLMLLAGMVAGEPRASAQIGVQMSNRLPGAPIDTRGGATLHVTIVDENKKPLKQQSMIRLTGKDTGRILF